VIFFDISCGGLRKLIRPTRPGMHRDAFASDTAALTALFNKTQTSQGTVAAVQTLSEINVAQVQQIQMLNDLISTQNLASSIYMASQNAKDKARFDANTNLSGGRAPTRDDFGKSRL